MDELIRPHDFEEAKEHIQTFANNTSACTDLDRVSTSGGLFGWFEHNVTGAELNKVTGQVQDHLVRINELQKSFISEFGQVYKALESLDSEYIKGILIAVKGAQESSDQAKRASEKAQKAQTDISKTIEGQKKVISILTDHKKKLETIKHLDNIDEIWKDLVDAKEVLDEMTETVEKFHTLIEKEKQVIYDVISEKEKAILSSIESMTEQSKTIQNEISSLESSIKPLLELEHVHDIDKIWAISNNNSASISEINNELDRHNASFVSTQERQDELFKELQETDKENQSTIEALKTKIKIAYVITGVLAAIEIVHLVVGFLI